MPPACAPEPEPAPLLELLLEIDADAMSESAADGAESAAAGAVTTPPTAWSPDHDFVHGWACHALAATVVEGAGVRHELSARLVSSATMRTLNRHWRGRDAPTNVLSFPSGMPLLALDAGATGADAAPLLALGDLVLCPAVVATEARDQGKPLAAHWAHLVVHGVLHLRGLDHANAADADAMERLEIRLLSLRDLPDPYGARPSPP